MFIGVFFCGFILICCLGMVSFEHFAKNALRFSFFAV